MPEPRAVPGAGVQLAATLSAAATSAVVLAALLFPAVAQAGETLWSCGGGYSNDVFVHSVIAGVDARSQCSTSSGGPGNPAFGGSMSLTTTGATVRDGKGGHWLATAPPGLRITAARIPRGALAVAGLNATGGYQGRFFWRRGGRAVQNGETSAFIGPFTSQYFGWAISLSASPFLSCPRCSSGRWPDRARRRGDGGAPPVRTQGSVDVDRMDPEYVAFILLRQLAVRNVHSVRKRERARAGHHCFRPQSISVAPVQRTGRPSDSRHVTSWSGSDLTDVVWLGRR